MPDLSDVITLPVIQSLCDPKTFARGKAYFLKGAVGRLGSSRGMLQAEVEGTSRYLVMLAPKVDGTLSFSCDCPVGAGHAFCKHAVAVALSWLENSGEEVFHDDEPEQPAKPRRRRKTYAEQVQAYVEGLDEAPRT